LLEQFERKAQAQLHGKIEQAAAVGKILVQRTNRNTRPVGDLFDVVPALTQAVKSLKSS